MQRVSGTLAALNMFLSKAAERSLSCRDTLKKCTNKKDFHWTIEAEEAFQTMKKLIAELPTLTAPKKEEELMVYLPTANEAVSAVLLVERDERQTPVHYVSRTLQGVEINYPPMEKLALALVHAARRLKIVELEAYGIKYALRSAIKRQVLADFLADTMVEDSPTPVKTDGPNNTLVEAESMEEQEAIKTKVPESVRAESDIWKLYTDGASNEHGSRAGLVLMDP
ncbi:reverse transcriptase domain-containing protein [Tanacetum coccineum]|uniref:Reverse transcriptase domain-containing protein n=1 Tax=Tanacetum coccineum TaxID=301880 RepID=A0ABQ5IBJ7_9ASTR